MGHLNSIILTVAVVFHGLGASAATLSESAPHLVCQPPDVLMLDPTEVAEQAIIEQGAGVIGGGAALTSLVVIAAQQGKTNELLKNKDVVDKVLQYIESFNRRQVVNKKYLEAQMKVRQFMRDHGVFERYRELRAVHKEVNLDELFKGKTVDRKIIIELGKLKSERVRALAEAMLVRGRHRGILESLRRLETRSPGLAPAPYPTRGGRLTLYRHQNQLFQERLGDLGRKLEARTRGSRITLAGGITGTILGFAVYLASENLAAAYEGQPVTSGDGPMSDAEAAAFDLGLSCLTGVLDGREIPIDGEIQLSTRLRGMDVGVPLESSSAENR